MYCFGIPSEREIFYRRFIHAGQSGRCGMVRPFNFQMASFFFGTEVFVTSDTNT